MSTQGEAMVSGWRARVAHGGDSRLLPDARLSGPMPWVIAIMIALTVIAAASGLALHNAARVATADLEGGVTVQVVSAAPAERTRQAQAALAELRRAPGVAEVRLVPQEELNTLVEPWLGTRPGDDVEALPIPALIDVRLTGSATPGKLAAIRAALMPHAPSVRVDAQAGWLAPVFAAIRTLEWMAAGLIALLTFATAAAVLLSARAALGNHRDTIEIVHMLGGTDRQVARVFQRSAMMDAAAGGIAGLLAGVVAIVAIGRQFATLGSGMAAGAMLGWADWIVIAAIPLAGVVLAVVTARLTVLAALRRML